MKTYTSIKQGETLAKILPLSSADMCWTNHCYGVMRSSMTASTLTIKEYEELLTRFSDLTSIDHFEPCWSLGRLLELIKVDITIEKFEFDQSGEFLYDIRMTHDDYRTTVHSELIDACIEFILELNKRNLLEK